MKFEGFGPFVILFLILVSISVQDELVKPKDDLFQLALEYLAPKGEINVHKAIQLLEEAGNEGHDSALYTIGTLYLFGDHGIKRDFPTALRYFNRSAELGNTDSYQALGFMWGTGKGVPINRPLSLLYHAFAAQAANPTAEMTLGYKYLMGQSVVKSCPKSVQRYEQAASKVVKTLRGRLMTTFHHENIRLSEAFDSARDKQKEEADIVQYYQYSADSGDAQAQVTMGTLHLQGAYGVEKNYNTAFSYFQKAALQGDAGGQVNVGFMYANGHGVDQNNETAISNYLEAAEKGHPQAQTNLGYMYMNGYGVSKNLNEALRYFKLAAEQGNAEGQVNLGTLYYNGEGVKQDYSKAIAYFTAAAQQGHLVAFYNLGQMQQVGLGVVPSCSVAVQMYKRVAEKGPWSSIIKQAYELYLKGDFEGALLRYEIAAEQGYEIAQANAGWILDKGLANLNSASKEDPSRYLLAFEYYRNSAEQKNGMAHLKIGDYYYYGLGTSINMEKAAQYYQAASDMRNAQATFNIGFMHQYGLGLPRDLYLAKRYYDMTLQADPDSYLAVYLSLLSLGVEFVADWYLHDNLQIWGIQWDTFLLALLGGILILCIIMRQHLA